MNKEEEIQLQNLATQVNQLNNEIQKQQMSLRTLENSINTIEEYEKLTEDKNSFVTLGSGVLVKSILKKQDTVQVNVGGILIEKKTQEAIEILKQRQTNLRHNMTEMQKAKGNLEQNYTQFLKKAQQK